MFWFHPHQQVVVGNASVIDEDGNRGVLVGDVFDERFYGVVVIDREFFAATAKAAFVDVATDGFSTAVAGGSTNDGYAFATEGIKDGTTDATAGSGDEGDL